jgi:hypothetical protein
MTSTALDAARAAAEATAEAVTTPRRMTVGRALEMLLESRGRSGAKTGAVTIGRSARGVTTWEITATADPDGLEQLEAALAAAIAAHDRLAELYPDTEGK